MPSSFFENKVHNLKIVQQKLEGITIYPGEYFSFWKSTGKASRKNGFKKDGILLPENYLRIPVAEFASFHLCYIMQL
jgi:vancomycin resistance protein YoaR